MAEEKVQKAKKIAPNSAKPIPSQQPKKKKKNAPDKPQPAWLFPPPDENPVLNPKSKSEEETKQEYEDRMAAIKFLKHKAVTAPMKSAPPTQLLTLVGAFLSSYGFNSTSRLFTLERNARKTLNGWDDVLGGKLQKGVPDLVKIYKESRKGWQVDEELDETSSDDDVDDDDDDDDAAATRAKFKVKEDDTSSSGGVSVDSDDSDTKPKSKKAKASVAKAKASKTNGENGRARLSSGSSSSSTSDSDADDEEEKLLDENNTATQKPKVGAMVNKLKRKPHADSPPISHESEDGSDLSSTAPAKKKKKKKKTTTKVPKTSVEVPAPVAQKATKLVSKQPTETPLPDSDPDSDSPSEESSLDDVQKDIDTKKTSISSKATTVQASNGRQSSTDSSTTLNASSPQKVSPPARIASSATSSSSESSSSDSESDAAPVVPVPKTEKNPKRMRSVSPKAANPKESKVAKKNNKPFSRIPEDTKVDPRLSSNAYVPYDYAQQAHQDLIVTKGKGFTKEKNKKKRGSYRGGLIDTSGGKAIKFDEDGQ